MKVTNNVKVIKHNLPSDAESSLILKTDSKIIVLRAAEQMEFSQLHIFLYCFLNVQLWESFLIFSSAQTQISFLSCQVSYFITISGIQNSLVHSSSPIWLQFPVPADDQEQWWIWLTQQGQHAGNDPPESVKSSCGRTDGSHLITAQDMLKVQAGAQFDSICSFFRGN